MQHEHVPTNCKATSKRKKPFRFNLTQNQCKCICFGVCMWWACAKCYSVKQWDETMHTLIKFGNVSSSDTQHTLSKLHTCNQCVFTLPFCSGPFFIGIADCGPIRLCNKAHELSGKFTIKICKYSPIINRNNKMCLSSWKRIRDQRMPFSFSSLLATAILFSKKNARKSLEDLYRWVSQNYVYENEKKTKNEWKK